MFSSAIWFSALQPSGQDVKRDPDKSLADPPQAGFTAILFYMTVSNAAQAPC